MHYTAVATTFLLTTALAVATPLSVRQDSTCPVVKQGNYVWKISDFYARKPDGVKVNSIGFHITSTNGAGPDFDCATAADVVEDGKLYPCKENSSIWFAFQNDRSGIIVQQSVSDGVQYIGTTTQGSYCRAGGNGPTDFICEGISDSYMTLVQYPGLSKPE